MKTTDRKGTMGWCHGFKLHFICNEQEEIIISCLTGANVDDRNPKVWSILGKRIYGKLFAGRGYISPSLFEALFADDVHLVTRIRSNMKNKLMPLWDKEKDISSNVLIICLRTRAIGCTQDTDPSTIS